MLLPPEPKEEIGVLARQLSAAMQADMTATAHRNLGGRPIRSRPAMVHDQSLASQADLTTAISRENRFAVPAEETPGNAGAGRNTVGRVRPRPAPPSRRPGSTRPVVSRLPFPAPPVGRDHANPRKRQAAFERRRQEFSLQPSRIERRVERPEPKAGTFKRQVGGGDHIGQFGPVNLIQRADQSLADGVGWGGSGRKGAGEGHRASIALLFVLIHISTIYC